MTQPPTGPDQPDPQPGQDPDGAPPPPAYPPPPSSPPPSYGDGYGATGAPPPQYGSPSYPPPAGNPYAAPSGYPTHAFTGEQGPPSKGLAIGALVSSLVCCLPIATVLGIIVLRRSRDGRDHGKGLAIAAIVLNVLAMLASIVLVVVAVVVGSSVRQVADLEPGDCISADGLRGDTSAGFETITVEDCTEPHDAEVLGTAVLTEEALRADEVDDQYGGICTDAIAEDPARAAAALRDDVSLLIIYDVEEPGEEVACLGLAADGGQLDAPLTD